MSLPSSLKSFVPLAVGLVVGGVGVSLFQQSLIGGENSPEQRAAKLETELKKAQNRIAALEDTDPLGRRKSHRTVKDSLADIKQRLKSGGPVTPDDAFRLFQPFVRDMSPIFERMRVRDQKHRVESMSGEFSRKYNLSTAQQESLKKWFDAKAEEKARDWTHLVTQEGVKMEDLAKASRDVRLDDAGLDAFMAGTLSGDKLTQFKTDRMNQRAERVQQYADSRTERLNSVVNLDAAQRDQVFGIMARKSGDYDPAMKLEGGAGEIGGAPAGNTRDAVLSVLRPDQREVYQADARRRRDEAAKDLQAIGLSLPDNWDPLEAEEF